MKGVSEGVTTLAWSSDLSSSQMVDLAFPFYFSFLFSCCFIFLFFLFLEQLGLRLIGHAVTSVTT